VARIKPVLEPDRTWVNAQAKNQIVHFRRLENQYELQVLDVTGERKAGLFRLSLREEQQINILIVLGLHLN
jgi:hypothetical protein